MVTHGFTVVLLVLVCVLATDVMAKDNMPADGKVSQFFPLTLIHINDFHARFEETNMKSNACKEEDRKAKKCIAGIARVYHMIKQLLEQYKDKNAIYLNAGDNYQGTLWYNLLRWNVTAFFIRKLKPAAMTLGNHEFDHTPKGLQPYLTELEKDKIPTVVANLEKNGDKDLTSNIPKTLVLNVGNKKVGIIGVLYDKTHEIAQTGNVILSNAIDAVKTQAMELKKNGIDIIVVLSHCSLDEDKKIAQHAGEHIDVIVGAHSHSFLYSPESKQPYDDKNDKIEGAYPLIITTASRPNRQIPIVQAKSFGKYVGRLTLYFDDKGEVKHWEGYPVFVNGSVKQDEQILKDMEPWRKMVADIGSTVIGKTEIDLDRESCRDKECTLGILVADAFADRYTNSSFRPFAIIQAGNFRNPIPKGAITNGDIIEAAPFGSTADLIRLKGDDIWMVAEHSFTWDDENRTNCLQVTGLRIEIDPNGAFYKRVKKIEVKDYSQPKSDKFKEIDRSKEYYVVCPSYLANGKDGFAWMKNATARWSGPLDSDVFKGYIEKIKTINSNNLKTGRVKIVPVKKRSK